MRPVQKTPASQPDLRFLRPESGGDQPWTEFAQSLQRADSWTEAQSLAEQHINSTGYPGTWGVQDHSLALLSRVYAAMKLAAAKANLEELHKALKPLQSDRKSLNLRATWNRLWDALLAAYLVPDVKPQDRGDIINALRSVRLLEIYDQLKTADDLKLLLRALPLIPSWSAQLRTGAEPSTETPVSPPPQPQIDPLRAEVGAIDAALRDLDEAYVRTARAQHRSQAMPAARQPAPPPDAQSMGIQLVDEELSPPWSRSGAVASALQPPTSAFLDSIDPAWKLRSHHDLIRLLEDRRETTLDSLERTAGRKSVSERRRTSSPRLTAATPLQPPDLLNVPISPTFEKSIVGSVGSVKPVGVGDLLIVEERLIGYREGELSHVENVMRSEKRERIHRQLDRVTTTTFTATETTEETERDLQSTERHEMQSEVQQTIQNEVALNTGVNVSAGFGPVVQVDTNADFAVSNSTENSMANSSLFAQEVVDHTVSKLTQSIREEITQTVLTETEETNRHGFDNNSPDHIIGIYRWLDKVYRAQVLNYGKRLMLEFIVPEPSAFYKFARGNSVVTDVQLEEPRKLPDDFSFEDMTVSGYKKWVDRYQVAGVNPPPPRYRVVSKVLEMPETTHGLKRNDYSLTTKSDSLPLPDGYLAKEGWVRGSWVIYTDQKENKQISVNKLKVVLGQNSIDKLADQYYATMDEEEATVPISVVAYNIAAYSINVEVSCERSEKTLTAWQMETYKKVVDAYNALQSAYDAAVEAARVAQSSSLTSAPPEAKRIIEQTELRKGCLVLLTAQHFHDFDATVTEAEPYGYPEFVVSQAMQEGVYSQFFEQCFEWEQMTYIFYPYFWGRKDEWVANSTESDQDLIFESFLRSGSARVLLPVRPKYEKALCYYLNTGEIWNGGEVPTLDDELYVSIAEEVAEAQDVTPDQARPYGEPWTYTLPTTLVKLQADATLPRVPPPA